MLHDMANSIFGIIALLAGFLCVSYIAIFMLAGFYYKKNKGNRKLRKKIKKIKSILTKEGKIRKIHLTIGAVLSAVSVLCGLLFLVFDWRYADTEYKYVKNKIATQKEISELFKISQENEVVQSGEEQNEAEGGEDSHRLSDVPEEVLIKLHILGEGTPEITESSISYYEKMTIPFYRMGNLTVDSNVELDEDTLHTMRETRQGIEELDSNSLDDSLSLFQKWDILYQNNHSPRCLYHSARAARDVVEIGHYELETGNLVNMAAEAIYRDEEFLKYGAINLNSVEEPVIMDVHDMAFYNGKTYYQLYVEAANRVELKKYRNDFLLLAYACMCRAEEEITQDHVDYARVQYYMGNISERMVCEISRDKEDELYREMGKSAMQHYKCAMDSIVARENYYSCESRMYTNTLRGINTVGELLKEPYLIGD